MPANSRHWVEFLDPALTEAFYLGFTGDGPSRRTSMIPTLYNVKGSKRADEQYLGAGVLSSQGWNFEDKQRVEYDEPDKGYLKTFTHVQFAKGIQVERRLVDDNLTQIAFDRVDGLGDSAYRKREKGAASVFNNAFTSTTNDDGFSTLGPDAVVLCSASHPRSAEDSTTTSNTGTTALSKASVGTTRIAMQKFTDSEGDIMDVMPDLILVPPELEDTALEITRSTLDPTSANNAINPQAGRFRHLVWHYLTDTNNWFMAEASRMQKYLIWYNRIALEFGREEDFDTFIAKYRAYMRYSYGWTHWQFIYGHAVTGS